VAEHQPGPATAQHDTDQRGAGAGGEADRFGGGSPQARLGDRGGGGWHQRLAGRASVPTLPTAGRGEHEHDEQQQACTPVPRDLTRRLHQNPP
jgi:hypothetical protein